jgi:hypothetical protein
MFSILTKNTYPMTSNGSFLEGRCDFCISGMIGRDNGKIPEKHLNTHFESLESEYIIRWNIAGRCGTEGRDL